MHRQQAAENFATESVDSDGQSGNSDAWGALVEKHSRLLVNVARSVIADHGGAMDAYAYVLERLHEGDFRRPLDLTATAIDLDSIIETRQLSPEEALRTTQRDGRWPVRSPRCPRMSSCF